MQIVNLDIREPSQVLASVQHHRGPWLLAADHRYLRPPNRYFSDIPAEQLLIEGAGFSRVLSAQVEPHERVCHGRLLHLDEISLLTTTRAAQTDRCDPRSFPRPVSFRKPISQVAGFPRRARLRVPEQ